MPTHLPHGLQKLLEVTVGMPWPEGDESGLRAMSAAWAQFAESLSSIGPVLQSEAQTFSDAMDGDTARKIEENLGSFPAGIEELRRGAGDFAKLTENAAADIQKAKIMIIVQLGLLAVAIAELLASLFGAVFVPVVVAAARLGIGALLRLLLSRLAQLGLVNIARTLATNMVKYAVINTAIMEGLDLGIQAGQILAGRRQGLDTESLKNTAIGGVIGGAAWGLGAGVSKVLSRAFTEGRLVAPGWFKPFAHLGYSAGQMALVTALAPGINKATHNSGSAFDGLLGNLSRADVHAPRIKASSIKPISKIDAIESLPVLPAKSSGAPVHSVPLPRAGVGFVSEAAGSAPSTKAQVPTTAAPVVPGRRSERDAARPESGQAPGSRDNFATQATAEANQTRVEGGLPVAASGGVDGGTTARSSPVTHSGTRTEGAGTARNIPAARTPPQVAVPGERSAPDTRRPSGLRDFLTTPADQSKPANAAGAPSAVSAGGQHTAGQTQPGHVAAAAPPETSHATGSREPAQLVHPVTNPVRPEQWLSRRENAPAGHLRTERFEPARGMPAGDGTVPGRATRILAEVRRIQSDDGRWVRDMTLALPVRLGEGVSPERLPEFESRWSAALDRQFNGGLLLPRSGDQLHVGLRLTSATPGQEAIELTISAAPGGSDQLHFRLQDENVEQAAARNDRLALHELSHFAGLPDTYLDPDSVFRDTAAKADNSGIMSDITRESGPAVPQKYLATIENVIDSGPVVRDHPLPAELEYGRPLATISEEAVREPTLHAPAVGFESLLRDLNVRVSEGAGHSTHAVELTGPAETMRRYHVAPVDGPLAERLPAGFTVSDTATGSRFHFSSEGALTTTEVTVEGDRGTLRQDLTAPEQAPTLVSSEQRPQERFPVDVRPDGTIALVSVSADGRALERLVVDPADGRVVETTGFGRHIQFKEGSSRLSSEELRAIDALAASTVREGLTAFDAKRPLPEVTVEGHANGTVLGQPSDGRANRNGFDRARAAEKAFTYSLEKYLARAAAERPVTPTVADFSVETSSQGRKYPAGVTPEDGRSGRRRAVITVTLTPHQSVTEVVAESPRTALPDSPGGARESAGEPESPQLTIGELVKREAEAPPVIAPPHAELPWYVSEEGMDSLGEVAISEADRWGESQVRHWTAEIANGVARGEDSPALAAGIRSALDKLLKGPETGTTSGDHSAHEAERNKELDFWETALQRGQLTTADGHTVWLRPVLRDVQPLPPAEATPIQRYNVNWGTLTTTEVSDSLRGMSADAMMLSTASTGAHLVSTVASTPYVGMSAHRTEGTSTKRYVIFDRKIWMLQGRPFRGGLHVRVFVDGEERLHDVVTEPRVTADLPKVLTNPGALKPAPHVVPPEPGPVAGPHRAHEVVNAIDLIPIAAEFQRRLRAAGLPPEGTHALAEHTLALLNERAVMNRSRFLLGNEVVTDRVSFPVGLGRSFKGHVALHAVVEGLEYLGDTPKVAVREDSGGSVKVQRERGGKSGFELGARVNVAPLEFVAVRAGMTRATGHGLTEETSIHTVLQTVDDQSRYRAWLRVTVEPRSTTHEIEPVVRIVPTEIGVPAIEAADFERRLLGEDAHLLRSQDGARSYVRAALADVSEHGAGLPESAYQRPARLDAPLAEPDPRESIALASRRGIGFASANGLPGAELIHDQLRTVLLQKHQEWTGKRRVDLSGVDRVLLSGFGRPVLEGDLPQLLAGVEHPVRVGDETYHLSATATLLERVGGVTGGDARAMSINMRASQIMTVDGHRDTSWTIGGFLGVRARVELTPELKVQLGQAGLIGSFGGGTKHEFSGSAKSSQRTEMGGKADEHVYNVVYELSVRRGDRSVRWWIDKPGEVVARVALPQLHTPPRPIPVDVAAGVGRITLWRKLPTEGTVDFRTNGTGAVFRSFLAVSEVPRMAAHLYRQANRLTEDWLAERGNWPAELRKMFSPTELATHFTALTSEGGRLTELPDGTDGRHQALRVRVVFKDPRHVMAHGEGNTFQMWQNTSTAAKYARTDKRVRAGGVGAHVGLSVKLGAAADMMDDEGVSTRAAAEGGGHGLAGHLYALGGGSVVREHESEKGSATYPVGITRGTYSGPMHSYRADPVFEITLSRWKKGSVVDRLTGRPHGMQETTRVVEVEDGVEFVLPQRRIFDLGLPVPDGVSLVEPKAPEGHFDLALLPGGTHPEVLHAEGVLPAMKQWLTEQGVLRSGVDGVAHVPTPILRELEASFSSSALLNQFTLLNTSGVMRWWPLESAFGSTRYLWARVTAETLEPMSQMDRPEMAAMLRGKAFTEKSTSESRSTEGEVGADLRAWLGGSRSGGLEGKASYFESSEKTHEKSDKNVDIYWGQTKGPSVELQLRQRFRVQMRITRQQPELFSAPVRGLRKVSHTAGWTGNRHEVAAGRQSASLTDKRFEAVSEGDVRVIVPRHLIVPGPPLPRSLAETGGADPAWEFSEPQPLSQELVDLAIEHGHPWAFPAVAAVHRWAAVAGASSLSRPGLAEPEAWRPEATTVEGMLYDLFTNEVLMRLNMPSLLRLGYSVPVGEEEVHVGVRIKQVTPMPEYDVDILSRHYNQGREVDEHIRGGNRGGRFGLGPIVAGHSEEGTGATGRLPLEYEMEVAGEQATESQEIMERNVSSTRPFRYYRSDVDVVIRSARHGWLRVHVPNGLYLMLPTSLSEEPAVRAAHAPEEGNPKDSDVPE